MPDRGMTMFPTKDLASAIIVVLLSGDGELDDWNAEVFEALCSSPSSAHMHFILPPPTTAAVVLSNSLPGMFGAFTGTLPDYASTEDVVEKLAVNLASSGRGWSWSASPSALVGAAGARGMSRTFLGARHRPLYSVWLRTMRYVPAQIC